MKRISLLAIVLVSVLFSVHAAEDAATRALSDKRMLQNVCAFKAPSIKETKKVKDQEIVVVSYIGFQRKPQRLVQTRDWGPNNIKWRIKSDKTGEIAVTGFAKLPETDEDLLNGHFSTVDGACLIAWEIGEITVNKQKYDLYSVDPTKGKEALNNRNSAFNTRAQKNQQKNAKADKDKKAEKNKKGDKDRKGHHKAEKDDDDDDDDDD